MKGFLKIKMNDGSIVKIYKEDVASYSTTELEFEKVSKNKTIKGTILFNKKFGFGDVLDLMKKDEKPEPWNFIDAVNAIKSGSHQIEKDCDNLDLLRDVLKEAFPEDEYDINIDPHCAFSKSINFYRRMKITNTQWGADEYNETGLPIIKLSQIMPKEVNVGFDGLVQIQKLNEKIERQQKRIDRIVKTADAIVAKLKKDDAPQVEEKPVELEVGYEKKIPLNKWLKLKDNRGIIFQNENVRFGFDNAFYGWFCVGLNELIGFTTIEGECTTEEITEALKAEAIKLKICDERKKWVELNGHLYVIAPHNDDLYCFSFQNNQLWYQGALIFENGIWAKEFQPYPEKKPKKS